MVCELFADGAVQVRSPIHTYAHLVCELITSGCIQDFTLAHNHIWHSVGKGAIWSFLETEILRKTGEIVKKLKKKRFSLFWRTWPPETLLRKQNTEKITSRLYSRSILHNNKGPIWSISVTVIYSACRAMQKQVPHS